MQTTPKPIHQIHAAVIGTGFIGPVHVEALRRLGVQVVALCDLPSCVETGASRLGIPRVFTDYRQLLQSSDVDVVHITAPNRFHCEMALAALAAGKHCVCEKPLALNTRETSSVLRQARKSHTVFAVGIFALPNEWHTPRIPGFGEIDWARFLAALYEIGYPGPVCIEIEDDTFGKELPGREQALKVARGILGPFFAADAPTGATRR